MLEAVRRSWKAWDDCQHLSHVAFRVFGTPRPGGTENSKLTATSFERVSFPISDCRNISTLRENALFDITAFQGASRPHTRFVQRGQASRFREFRRLATPETVFLKHVTEKHRNCSRMDTATVPLGLCMSTTKLANDDDESRECESLTKRRSSKMRKRG